MTPKQAATLYARTKSVRAVMKAARCEFAKAKRLIVDGGGVLLGRRRKSRMADDELVEAYKTKSVNAVAKLNGTSYVAVLRRLHRLKVPMRKQGNNEVRITVVKHGFAKRALELGVPPQRYVRLLAVMKMGGKCRACGCADARVLCLNHVNGQDKPGRREVTKLKTQDCLRILAGEAVPHLEVLCANCNHLHEYERGNVKDVSAIVATDFRKLENPHGQVSDP